MTMAGTDSIAKGNLSQRSRYIPSESNKVHRGDSLKTKSISFVFILFLLSIFSFFKNKVSIFALLSYST